jgi:hypothetical protein
MEIPSERTVSQLWVHFMQECFNINRDDVELHFVFYDTQVITWFQAVKPSISWQVACASTSYSFFMVLNSTCWLFMCILNL